MLYNTTAFANVCQLSLIYPVREGSHIQAQRTLWLEINLALTSFSVWTTAIYELLWLTVPDLALIKPGRLLLTACCSYRQQEIKQTELKISKVGDRIGRASLKQQKYT